MLTEVENKRDKMASSRCRTNIECYEDTTSAKWALDLILWKNSSIFTLCWNRLIRGAKNCHMTDKYSHWIGSWIVHKYRLTFLRKVIKVKVHLRQQPMTKILRLARQCMALMTSQLETLESGQSYDQLRTPSFNHMPK